VRRKMRIELARTAVEQEMGVESCGICGLPFTLGTVRAEIVTDDEHGAGLACPRCLEALSNLATAQDGRFPSPAKVWDLEAFCWRTPEFGSVEELERAERA
jgi:hypothetical protein